MNLPLFLLAILWSANLAIAQNTIDSTYYSNITTLYGKAFQHLYSNQDSAFYYFDKINTEAIKHEDIESLISSLSASNKTAAHFYNLERLKLNLKQLDSIVLKNDVELRKTDNYLVYINNIYFDKGIYYFTLNDYENARKSYQAIISSIEALKENELNVYLIDLLTSAYSYIAKMYVNDEKYELAKDYYTKNIHYLETKKADDIIKINRNYSLLAEVLKLQNQLDASNLYFKKSLEYNLNNQGNSSSIITEANHLLENYLSKSKTDSAFYYLKIIKDHLSENHPIKNRYYEAKAKIYNATGEYELAQAELQKALEFIKQKWQNKPHNEVAEIYNTIGKLHFKFNQPEKALESYNLAISQFPLDKTNSTINETTILKVLKNKADVLNSKQLYVDNILTVNQALQTLDLLKPTFKSNEDKLFLMEDAFPIFESGMEATYNLYNNTKQDSLIDRAFYYSEKSKSVLLLDALLSTRATKFANIPKDIIEKEQVLKSQINYLEKKLNKSKTNTLENELFETKRTYRELINTIETNYKSYYDLKYSQDVISISDFQKFLKPKEALLSYFYGNKAIYIISVSKNSKTIQQYKLNPAIKNEIISIYSMLNNPTSDLEVLNKKTNDLYKKLVVPSLEGLSGKKLIVVTDGLLNYVPFSSLSTDGDSNYLIEKHAISYANSATLLKQLSEKENTNNKVLAFAPSFEASSYNNLLPLPHNQNEAEDILNYFDGKTLIKEQATLQNFNLESKNYGLLHFATHAILNDEVPEYSYLAFEPNNAETNLLYVSDLYNLNLNSNLVTLSACESGIGNLKRGEGFISLARGFYFSGASSISSTLWKINDGSALKIMDVFYKNLSEGKSKNLALQQAQVSYIKDNNQNSLIHPYYWSGFVISGKTAAITSPTNLWWYVFGIGALVILVISIRKFKKTT
ncbi:CHAT domain-containing protein [Xanthomarina sp. F1114]|uniref:CHAT domain-containing protein n=1 Tax=Xanthomarina sp. F1114 TaxID=2996019 RepID=UPI00225E38A4|nr:CHAT domain-containing protein [Xanthomarina sp. F1114]MCX7547817.1 CHAT domain-containing protein [Xanthomarina sp. F1114]